LNHYTKQSVGGLALLTLPSGWLVGWQAKANVPNVGGNKNFNFFCAWEKNKNTKQGSVGEKGLS
jgi:hypothetical protein